MSKFARGCRTFLVILGVFGALYFPAHAQDRCSFDYAAVDGVLASSFIELPREALSKNTALIEMIRRALPNVRRVFGSVSGYTALVGWSELPEDYSKYSDLQAERKLVDGAERSKFTVNAGKQFTYQSDFGPPISIFYSVDYSDNSKEYRDTGMDVLATSRCLFSIKFSGPRKPNDDNAWQGFHDELERMRGVIANHEGPIQFSKTGAFFSLLGIVNVAIYAVAGAIVGAVIAFCLTRRYQIKPGRAARRYSLAIIFLCLFMLGLTGFVAALIGTAFKTNDEALLFVLILAVHLNAYIRRSPMAVLSAVSLALGLLVVAAIYMALGWRTPPAPAEAVGIAIGLAMVLYVLVGTLSRRAERNL
jgi:hypothetical protein